VTKPAHILVVEDEPRISEVVIAYLQHAGHETLLIEDGALVMSSIAAAAPSLMVLDLMLPGIDGVSLCRDIRKHHQFPIIMVTARVEEIDRLLGFEVGADDYVCKPFSPKELVARVNALLKRSRSQALSHEQPIDEVLFRVDEDAQRIYFQAQPLPLTPQEYRLLSVFISAPGRIFTRAQLLELAYDDNLDVFDRAIDSHIKNLRKRLKSVLGEQEVIHSVYGVGYRFE